MMLDVHPLRLAKDLVQDLRYAWRQWRRSPGFTVAIIATLALGIGANTAVYSLLDAVILHPLGYSDPDRLQLLWTVEGSTLRGMNSSYPDFIDWRRQARSFERIAAFRWNDFNLTTGAGEAERISAIEASPGLLETFGVAPSVGRTIVQDDDRQVAVITHALWTRRFAAERSILGKTLHLDGRTFVVVGVLPRSFHFQPRRYAEPDLFIPLEPSADRQLYRLMVLARLRAGVSRDQAQAEMNRIAGTIAEGNSAMDPRQGVRVDPLHRYVVQGTERTGAVLFGAVAFLLLIACANVANLLIARGVGRQREIAIRLAIGASRGRVMRQMLTESLATALVGGTAGLALAYLVLPLLAAIAPEHTSFLTRVQDNGIHVDRSVLLFTAAVSVFAAFLFGLFPALRSTRPLASSVQVGCGRAPVRNRIAGVLIAIEVALSFVLLASAGLMVGTLSRLLSVDPGFRADNLLTLSVSLPLTKYADRRSQSEYHTHVLDRLRGLADVRATAAVSMPPLMRETWRMSFETEDPQAQSGQTSFHVVSQGYFETMGIPVLRGRSFIDSDGAAARLVAVVSRSFERRYWTDGSAIGKGLTAERPGSVRTRFEIVGVVGDVRQLGLDDDPRAEWYVPSTQWGSGNPANEITFVVRPFAAPTLALEERAKAALRAVDPDLPVTTKTMAQLIATDTASPRFVLALMSVFACIAVALAAFGIYGVVSHAVARRSGELAVRLALGATRSGILALVVREHLEWVMGGILAGVLGARLSMRLLVSQLHGITPTDIPTYTAAALVIVVVAVLADIVPAWRTTRILPADVLRSE